MRQASSLLVFLSVVACTFAKDKNTEPNRADRQISYYREIRPIFQQHCQGCHQPARPKGGLIMTDHAGLLKKGDSDLPAVVPGKPEKSYLVELIEPRDGKKPRMPEGRDPLHPTQVELIKRWIAQGAVDDTPASAKRTLTGPPTYQSPPVITSLDYSPDGKILAVSGYHEVLLHKPDGSGLIGRLVGLSERIESVRFSPDGKRLAVAGGSPGRFGEVQIWDVHKRNLLLSLPVTFDTVYGVSWSHDGELLSFGCADNTLRAIEAKTGKQVVYQGAHSDWVLETVFSLKSTHIVSVSRDRSMKLTEVATQRFVDNITSITPGALKGGLMTVDRHPTKEEVAVGGADGQVKLYQIFRTKPRKIGDDFNKIRDLTSLPGRIFAVRFNKDGSRVIAGSSYNGRGYARIVQTADGKTIADLEGTKGAIYAVAYRPDSKQVATAGFDGYVRLNDAHTGKLLKEFVPVPLVQPGRN
ncbi:MAG: hypothetical protein KatS3mg105_3339 [Gemmatales bacterium]|nr:MAG: hypothetical protein KatS3mg105_3339 [Gemmatales bacterium]